MGVAEVVVLTFVGGALGALVVRVLGWGLSHIADWVVSHFGRPVPYVAPLFLPTIYLDDQRNPHSRAAAS
ncbi:MAG: hypothetical protein JWO98_4733 [Frankiales bacterium]|nr:hypothetical protein [Frankiales bacterium]